ncbi:hypothetical protein G7Y79_00008g023830 [Physcia stellaris]|nr:hypothetical protein G7Y79_00008g023830 [Physcia stellaris]
MPESLSANKVPNDDTPLAERALFEANDDHSVPLETSTPAFVAVLRGDAVRGDQTEVARGANVVIAVVALRAVEASRRRWDGQCTDITGGVEGEGYRF